MTSAAFFWSIIRVRCHPARPPARNPNSTSYIHDTTAAATAATTRIHPQTIRAQASSASLDRADTTCRHDTTDRLAHHYPIHAPRTPHPAALILQPPQAGRGSAAAGRGALSTR